MNGVSGLTVAPAGMPAASPSPGPGSVPTPGSVDEGDDGATTGGSVSGAASSSRSSRRRSSVRAPSAPTPATATAEPVAARKSRRSQPFGARDGPGVSRAPSYAATMRSTHHAKDAPATAPRSGGTAHEPDPSGRPAATIA